MAKTNNQTAVLDPSVQTDQPVADATTAKADTISKAAKAVGGGLIGFVAQQSEAATRRIQLRQVIRQHLAEVSDMALATGTSQADLTAKASEVAFELYEARCNNDLTAVEVSETLGDIFGVKGTGKNIGKVMRPGEKGAGKTPAGTGEEIRKRVVRAYAAWDFANNGPSDRTSYFDGFDQADVAAMVETLGPALDDNHRSLWRFYDDVAKEKREMNDPVPFHLNGERVAKLAKDIGQNIKAVAAAINGDPDLKAAYAGLINQLLIANELID